MACTYDLSPQLNLALVADADLGNARYVALPDAPLPLCPLPIPYLLQLHAVANSVPAGLTVMSRMPFEPALWLVLSGPPAPPPVCHDHRAR